MTTSSKTKPAADQPLIDAVCLIPEIVPPMLYAEPERHCLEVQLGELLTSFAGRFAYGFMVSVRDGLLTIGKPYAYSGQVYAELAPERRHAFLMALREQLGLLTRDGRPCISLVGSVLAQGMRGMGLAYSMPLAAMSKRQRREWLQRRFLISSEVLSSELFGKPIIQSAKKAPAAFSI